MNVTALLRSTDLLAGVSDAALERICASMREVTLPAGATLFNQDDPGDAVYVILEGSVALQRDGVTLMTRGAGSWIGEFALIDNEPRSASATSVTDARLLKWVREEFLRVISQRAEVAYGVFRMLTRKLRQDADGRVRLALEQERWRQDLMRAREIQISMLPKSDLRTARTQFSGFCRPAAEVGGDYYDVLELNEDKTAVIMGDVTGHGFYAGLFVAMAKSCVNNQHRIDTSPTEVMEAMRETLALSIQPSLLMTCCYVQLEPRSGTLTYVNAGHPPPYLYSAATSRLDKLEALDPLLGVHDLHNAPFMSRERPWSRGDVLVIYSDGLTEARNRDGEPFGEHRVEECIKRTKDREATGTKAAIIAELASHAGERAYDDDVTMVVARAM